MLFHGTFQCGGSLIAPQWILTAAHCVSTATAHPEWFEFRMGVTKLASPSENMQQRRAVAMYIHPEYDINLPVVKYRPAYDIALFKLETPFNITDYVRTVCLPQKDMIDFPDSTEVTITGWGMMNLIGPSGDDLQEVELFLVNQTTCVSQWLEYGQPNLVVTDDMICVGLPGVDIGESACYGDSGGPLVLQTGEQWTLLGVTNYGEPTCTTEYRPNVYARVTSYLDWIQPIFEDGEPDSLPVYQFCPGNKYRCERGACLEREVKCDGRYDCASASDERNCGGIMIFFDSFKDIRLNDTSIRESVSAMSPEECARICLNKEEFRCIAFDFSMQGMMCLIAGDGYSVVPDQSGQQTHHRLDPSAKGGSFEESKHAGFLTTPLKFNDEYEGPDSGIFPRFVSPSGGANMITFTFAGVVTDEDESAGNLCQNFVVLNGTETDGVPATQKQICLYALKENGTVEIKGWSFNMEFHSANVSTNQFVAAYKAEWKCDEKIMIGGDTVGSVTSPLYPNAYPLFVDCRTVLMAPEGAQVILELIHFDLNICLSQDSITVFDGTNESAPVLASCNFDPPEMLSSSKGFLLIIFRSDGYTTPSSNPGFKLTYSTEPNRAWNCSDTLVLDEGDTGYITSPLYPDVYPMFLVCHTLLMAPEGAQVILELVYFDLNICLSGDYIAVYDGPNPSPKPLISCSSDVSEPPQKLISSKGALLIVFHTDGKVVPSVKPGFNVTYYTKSSQEICGLQTAPLDGEMQIVGGKPAQEGEWPWQAAMFFRGIWICGGSLIHPQWILTSATCLGSAIKYPELYHFSMGSNSLKDPSESMQMRRAAEVYMHPDHKIVSFDYKYDIALIKLESPFNITQFVRTVCLPRDSALELPNNTGVTVTGWGRYQPFGEFSDYLLEVEMRTVNQDYCASKWAELGYEITDTVMCVFGPPFNLQGACEHDNGGPVVVQNLLGWTVVGVIGSDWMSCYPSGYPEVHTRVSPFLDWIQPALEGEEPPRQTSNCSGDEYLCRLGGCINRYRKCNGFFECSSGSDEEYCDSLFLVFDAFYDVRLDNSSVQETVSVKSLEECPKMCLNQKEFACHAFDIIATKAEIQCAMAGKGFSVVPSMGMRLAKPREADSEVVHFELDPFVVYSSDDVNFNTTVGAYRGTLVSPSKFSSGNYTGPTSGIFSVLVEPYGKVNMLTIIMAGIVTDEDEGMTDCLNFVTANGMEGEGVSASAVRFCLYELQKGNISIEVKGSSFMLEFHSDNVLMNQFIGTFEAEWTCDDKIMVGENDTGYITSPLYPAGYPKFLNCHILLMAPEGAQVAVRVIYYDLTICSSGDYSAAYDGTTSNSSKLLSSCSSDNPPEVLISTEGAMLILFKSDGQDIFSQKPGFNLTYYSGSRNRGCSDSYYMCKSGDCVPREYKCNGIKDCTSGSDEEYCDELELVFDAFYNIRLDSSSIQDTVSVDSSKECTEVCLNQANFACFAFDIITTATEMQCAMAKKGFSVVPSGESKSRTRRESSSTVVHFELAPDASGGDSPFNSTSDAYRGVIKSPAKFSSGDYNGPVSGVFSVFVKPYGKVNMLTITMAGVITDEDEGVTDCRNFVTADGMKSEGKSAPSVRFCLYELLQRNDNIEVKGSSFILKFHSVNVLMNQFVGTYKAEWRCDDTIVVDKDNTGYVTSPLYPAAYPMFLNCHTLLKAPEGAQVFLKSIHFDWTICSSGDDVAVYDGTMSDPSMLLTNCSTTEHPPVLSSTRGALLIVFTSDGQNSSSNQPGFKFSYHSHPVMMTTPCPMISHDPKPCDPDREKEFERQAAVFRDALIGVSVGGGILIILLIFYAIYLLEWKAHLNKQVAVLEMREKGAKATVENTYEMLDDFGSRRNSKDAFDSL
ncbi:uncharacterized protein LOC110983096 isoform X2 [Acanthaster planci]|nr:uncharacterized protein LOC110983096 isoform X2 [Acanthaster planci]